MGQIKNDNIFLSVSVASDWGKSYSEKLALDAEVGAAFGIWVKQCPLSMSHFRCSSVPVVSGCLTLALT